jgi:CIC family chloride channel protein
VEGTFDGWRMPLMVKAGLGMGLTAGIALLLPQRDVLGSGLHFIGEAIADDFDFSLGMMAALLLLKLAATSFTLGSGNSGGVFAPALYMGAVLGGIVGTLAHGIWPAVAVNPGAYAIVGMAAVFAAAARAPITAVLIVFEMSGDYKLILPLLMATVLATLVAEVVFAESIYTLKLKLKGIRWQRGRDENILHSVTVGEVMAKEMDALRTTMTLSEASDLFAATHHHGMPVLDEAGALQGLVTITDMDRATDEGTSPDAPIVGIATPRSRLVVAYPDETIGIALDRMSPRGFGRLPVVSREDPNGLRGMIGRSNIIQAYHVAVSRQQSELRLAQHAPLHVGEEARFIEVRVGENDPIAGETVQKLMTSLPADCVLVSVERNGHTILPHGDTVLQPGDLLVAFTHCEDAEQLLAYMHPEKTAVG